MPTQHEITPDDHQLLRFKERHPALGLEWEAAILAELGLTQPTYYHRLFVLVERPEVVAQYPQGRVSRAAVACGGFMSP